MICDILGIPVNYEQYGEGKPILCIHGYWVDHRLMSGCMEPVFNQVSGYRRIYLDLPGMGKTPTGKWIKSSDDVLKIICGFIDEIIPDDNFLLVGESYGGYLSMGLIYQMRERIDGVMMICPLIAHDHESLPLKQTIWQSDTLPYTNADSDIASFLDMAVVATPEIFEAYKNDILSGIMIADKDFLANHFDGKFSDSFDAEIRTMVLDKPSCILTGRQDHVVGYSDAYTVLDRFPRATFVILDCAGHNAQIDNSILFAHLMRDWIWRVELGSQA